MGEVVLLTWLGTGDEPTDVAAHLSGFIAGTLLGAALPMVSLVHRVGPRGQLALGTLSALAITTSWRRPGQADFLVLGSASIVQKCGHNQEEKRS